MSEKYEHIMIIPDGNRRYAFEHGISAFDSYRLATKRLVESVRWCLEHGRFHEISLGCLTTDNFSSRPVGHIRELTNIAMDLLRDVASMPEVESDNLVINAVGNSDLFSKFSPSCVENIAKWTAHTRKNVGRIVNVNYAYDPDATLKSAIAKCTEDGVPLTLQNIAVRGERPPVTFSLRAGYPPNFNKVSVYSPGIERARLYASPTTIQEMSREQFLGILDEYFCLSDSVERKHGTRMD